MRRSRSRRKEGMPKRRGLEGRMESRRKAT